MNEIYKEMVEVMDEGVGEIINALIELDLENNSIFLFRQWWHQKWQQRNAKGF